MKNAEMCKQNQYDRIADAIAYIHQNFKQLTKFRGNRRVCSPQPSAFSKTV